MEASIIELIDGYSLFILYLNNYTWGGSRIENEASIEIRYRGMPVTTHTYPIKRHTQTDLYMYLLQIENKLKSLLKKRKLAILHIRDDIPIVSDFAKMLSKGNEDNERCFDKAIEGERRS